MEQSRYSETPLAGPPWDRIPVGTRFPASVQTRPGVHPDSSKWVPGLFPGVRRSGRGVDRPVVQQYLYSVYIYSFYFLLFRHFHLSISSKQTFVWHY
jgi:hypothetical protein